MTKPSMLSTLKSDAFGHVPFRICCISPERQHAAPMASADAAWETSAGLGGRGHAVGTSHGLVHMRKAWGTTL